MADQFRAVRLEQGDGVTRASIATIAAADLPPGEVEVDVACSTLNYKDALAITGAGKIVRDFPFVPGVDFAGTVRNSADSRFQPGQEVFLTGWGVGERHWGGLAERARVKADWLLPRPEGLTLAETMAIGTAGFTAMLSVLALEEQGVRPGDGEIVVTGAAGGVGSVAIPLLRHAGVHRGRVDRPRGARRLSHPPRRASGRRPRPVQRGLQGSARYRHLGRGGGFGRRRHPGQPAQGHALPRRRRRLRACGGCRVQWHGVSVHSPRRQADRYRFRLLPAGAAPGRVGPARPRPRPATCWRG